MTFEPRSMIHIQNIFILFFQQHTKKYLDFSYRHKKYCLKNVDPDICRNLSNKFNYIVFHLFSNKYKNISNTSIEKKS